MKEQAAATPLLMPSTVNAPTPSHADSIYLRVGATTERRSAGQLHDVLPEEGDWSRERLLKTNRLLTQEELFRVTKTEPEAITSDEDEEEVPRPKRGTGCWGHGPPLTVYTNGRPRPFADGAGLCSPGRWPPEKRRNHPLTWPKAELLHDCLKALLSKSLDVKKVVCELAVGRYVSTPFGSELLEQGRMLCSTAIDMQHDQQLAEVADGQCFRLRLIGAMLRKAEDPDWRVYHEAQLSFARGVCLGYREPLPRIPAVFDRKKTWKHYGEDDLAWAALWNYGTTDERREQIAKQFEEERQHGMMMAKLTAQEVAAEWQESLKIASLGDIQKADGTLRIIHDGTHGVLLNPEIRQRDHAPTPGIGEERRLQEDLSSRGTSAFGLKADVSKAHRRFKLQRRDWGLVACCLVAPEIWLNPVGTFGVASSNYWFARLIGRSTRLVNIFLGRAVVWQLLYSDDYTWVANGPYCLHELVLCIFLFELLGVPLS